MYVYKCLRLAETSIFFEFVFILLPFLTVAQHEIGTRRTISCSVTVYSKYLSSQFNLIAKIKQMQDNMN